MVACHAFEAGWDTTAAVRLCAAVRTQVLPLRAEARHNGTTAKDGLHAYGAGCDTNARRFFRSVLRHGTTVLFTSNRKPADLYKGGLSYKYFEPFIHLIHEWVGVCMLL